MLTFYCLSGSPFSWKVWLALEHKRIAYDLRVLSADAGDLKAPAFLALNPRGKVPVIADQGLTLSETSAIIEYLHESFPGIGEPLWPDAIDQRAAARRLSEEASAYLYPNVRRLVVEIVNRRDGEPEGIAIGDARVQIERDLALFGARMAGPFMAGDMAGAADFAVYPLVAILRRVHQRQPGYGFEKIIPHRIRDWMARVEQLSYFEKTIPPHWKPS